MVRLWSVAPRGKFRTQFVPPASSKTLCLLAQNDPGLTPASNQMSPSQDVPEFGAENRLPLAGKGRTMGPGPITWPEHFGGMWDRTSPGRVPQSLPDLDWHRCHPDFFFMTDDRQLVWPYRVKELGQAKHSMPLATTSSSIVPSLHSLRDDSYSESNQTLLVFSEHLEKAKSLCYAERVSLIPKKNQMWLPYSSTPMQPQVWGRLNGRHGGGIDSVLWFGIDIQSASASRALSITNMGERVDGEM
ncbi:hypothetical protein FOPE_09901 [Fonsecaea pedrosoi]|nr:hypothetical protein FOPE_09901 [Fonsecaea pedrosoi]